VLLEKPYRFGTLRREFVFDGDKTLDEAVVIQPLKKIAENVLKEPWTVTFDPEYGTKKKLQFLSLMDWKDHKDPEVKYYSGPAIYETQFNISKTFLESGDAFTLDLGDVQIAATININGSDVGTLWKSPFQLDVSELLQKGQNKLSIKVVNLWPNRLIGDAALPDVDNFTPEPQWVPQSQMPEWYSQNKPPELGERLTFTTADFYKKTDPLLSSGLMGPVRLIAFEAQAN